ncbi:TPA: ClbS/DfsB family four-helix bundle protein [Photobacterium damselae]
MSSIPTTKEELEKAINDSFSKLLIDLKAIPESESRRCEIEGNSKGCFISVCDSVAYLIGWQKLVLKWYYRKSHNLAVDFPETGYKWNQLGLLAQSFYVEYRDWTYSELLSEFESNMEQILVIVASLSNHQLYQEPWYEKWTLGRMIQFNTSSPMKNVRTKVRRFKRGM